MRFSRRALLASAPAVLAAPALAQASRSFGASFQRYPFSLGVAAGEPAPGGFTIWTRLAPEPLAPGGGMAAKPVSVRYEVSETRDFAALAAEGEVVAWPEVAHSARATLANLLPDRVYFYRFIAGGERSPTGRARTLPAPGAPVGAVRLGVVGCQHYEEGLYTAFRHLGREDCHAVFHYGDYIYEYPARATGIDRRTGEPVAAVREHLGGECLSLDDYRRRYAQTRLDVDLQFAHASAAWLPSYDDHEIDNNWVNGQPQDDVPPALFHLRRQAAMQAWYEHMPVPETFLPQDGRIDAWRGFRWGGLLDARVLNTRAHRTDQPCNDLFASTCPEVRDPRASVLGAAQEDWLVGLNRAPARWNALLQQIMMMDLQRTSAGRTGINTDSWAGYAVPRDRLLSRLTAPNLVVLTGDEHQNFAGEVRPTAGGAARAIEFVTTSATSGGEGGDGVRPDHAAILSSNPQLKFVNNQRGYAVMNITPDAWETRFRVVDTVTRPGGQVSTRATFRVPAGRAVLEA
jgi:alkaline phosphatase D